MYKQEAEVSDRYQYEYSEDEIKVVDKIRKDVQQLSMDVRLPSNFSVHAFHGGNEWVAMGLFPKDPEVCPADVFAPFVEYWRTLHNSWVFELRFEAYVLSVQVIEPQFRLYEKRVVVETWDFKDLESCGEALGGITK